MSEASSPPRSRTGDKPRRWWPALGLFLLAPFVAEFLHGNMSISALPWLVLAAPLYGGGAVLIREVTRSVGRGWPTMVLLGVAYAVIEEGLVTQTLFNPSYFGYPLLSWAPVPGIGMGAWWTMFVLTLHTVWSMSASIALVDALVPARRSERWLGMTGVSVAGIMFVLGAGLNAWATYDQERFVAAPAQLAGAAAFAGALVVVAFRVKGPGKQVTSQPAPPPWVAGACAFAATTVFMILSFAPGWPAVGVYAALYLVVAIQVRRWSRRAGWGALHHLGLAAGALLTYAWYAFPSEPLIGATGAVDLIGNVTFAGGLAVLIGLAAHRGKRHDDDAARA